MAMTQEEKIEIADMVRSRDRFGPVSEEELAALPGKETELWIRTKNGKTVHVFEERPENLPEQAALLLNFHGGGFLKGRTDRDRRYCCWAMEQLNCLVWDIDYSLAPENPFPFAAEEAYEIVSYAFEHSTELGIDQEKIILAGHSAGSIWNASGKSRSLCDNAADHRGYAWIYYKPDTWLGTGTGSSVQIFSGAFKIEQMSKEKILYEE